MKDYNIVCINRYGFFFKKWEDNIFITLFIYYSILLCNNVLLTYFILFSITLFSILQLHPYLHLGGVSIPCFTRIKIA